MPGRACASTVVRKNSIRPEIAGFFDFDTSCFHRENPARYRCRSGAESRSVHFHSSSAAASVAFTASSDRSLEAQHQKTEVEEKRPIILVSYHKDLEALAD